MLKVTAYVSGVDQINAKFSRADDLRARVREAVDLTALEVQRIAQDRYLSGPRPTRLDVVTGRLRRSINVKRITGQANQIGASVGTNVEYARRWELGFAGTEQVSAHYREVRRGRKTYGMAFVHAHPRRVNVRPRPFLSYAFDDVREIFRERVRLAAQGSTT